MKHQERIPQLWSSQSEVAVENEYAWLPTAYTAEGLATTGPDNRVVTSPYPKLLCANLQVDLASGVIITSVAAAEQAGFLKSSGSSCTPVRLLTTSGSSPNGLPWTPRPRSARSVGR